MNYIDITTPISDQMVHWPDNAPVHLRLTRSFAYGDPANVSEISMSVHTATHVDAPRHFIKEGPDVTTLDDWRSIEAEYARLTREVSAA